MSIALVLGALLAVGVRLPRRAALSPRAAGRPGRARRAGELDRRRLELAEARDRALGALKELELDHRTGKVSDEDYRALVGPLRREAAAGAAGARAARRAQARV